MAHPIRDSSSNGRSEVLRSAHNLMAFSNRGGVTPAHIALDLRRRSLSPDPNLEAEVLAVIGELVADGLMIGGSKLASPVSLTRAGAVQGRNPQPPAIVGGRGEMR